MASEEPGGGMTEFSVEQETIDERTVVVRPVGEIDLHTAPQMREGLSRVIDAGATRVVVDLEDVPFMDSMALGVLLGAAKQLRPLGGHVYVAASDPGLRKIFEITMLDRVFRISASLDEALAAPLPEGGA